MFVGEKECSVCKKNIEHKANVWINRLNKKPIKGSQFCSEKCAIAWMDKALERKVKQ